MISRNKQSTDQGVVCKNAFSLNNLYPDYFVHWVAISSSRDFIESRFHRVPHCIYTGTCTCTQYMYLYRDSQFNQLATCMYSEHNINCHTGDHFRSEFSSWNHQDNAPAACNYCLQKWLQSDSGTWYQSVFSIIVMTARVITQWVTCSLSLSLHSPTGICITNDWGPGGVCRPVKRRLYSAVR